MRPNDPPREIEVHATKEEISHLAEVGYMIKERLFTGDALKTLRDAMDHMETREMEKEQFNGDGKSTVKNYGGYYYRYLMDKEQAFLDLLHYQPLLSIARALMGPMIKMDVAARITYPSSENQETEWHQHRRYIPKPLPPWFIRPHALDVLIYLDDVNEANGPLCVLPDSHHRIQEEPAPQFYGEFPDQVKLCPPDRYSRQNDHRYNDLYSQICLELACSVEMNGGTMLDSPVTGGVGGAEKGSLSIMVGGDESAFKAHQGKSVV